MLISSFLFRVRASAAVRNFKLEVQVKKTSEWICTPNAAYAPLSQSLSNGIEKKGVRTQLFM